MPTILCLAVLLASASLGAAAAQDDEHDLLDVAVGGDHDFEELSPPADPAGDELDMAKVMAEERSYFLKHDADGDGALDRDEFEATERNAAGGVDEAGEAGHAKDGSIDAKEREESGFAFTEFDKDKDAKVSWDEWAALMSSPTLDGTLWYFEHS
ncbi:hypothetical protein T484DRAFT_1762130 [Baffinella frigidus]|nr:hypothetical protein T484DRAFT_1762130 [Cryptophyta sp. CCMP2293]